LLTGADDALRLPAREIAGAMIAFSTLCESQIGQVTSLRLCCLS
jgi:hypothetical protein